MWAIFTTLNVQAQNELSEKLKVRSEVKNILCSKLSRIMRIDGLTFVLSCWQLGWQNILNLCEYNGYDNIKMV